MDHTASPEKHAETSRAGRRTVSAMQDVADMQRVAADLDERDDLAGCRDLFLTGADVDSPVRAYLDGNSLGRPLRASRDRLAEAIAGDWATGLIRSWDASWLDLPLVLGDRIGRALLGAAPNQTVVADSTTVLLYKLVRAAITSARKRDVGRNEIIVDSANFPTDRYIAEAVASETGSTLRWVEPDEDGVMTAKGLEHAVGARTAVVLLSHVAYLTAGVTDLAAVTRAAHEAGALVLADLSHSVGVVPVGLDDAQVDLAVGCTYKFLSGGPGSPAFAYVAHRHQDDFEQPITGWLGHADPFAMGPAFAPAAGVRRLISGTPPILGMMPLLPVIDLIEEVGLAALTAKSRALGDFVIASCDALLGRHGVGVGSPRDSERRGGHVMLTHPDARGLQKQLWQRGIIPDFREPDGVRLGLAPLTTSFAEVALAIAEIVSLLDSRDRDADRERG